MEEDPWDVRIEKTGCAAENEALLICHADSGDWRKCLREMQAFRDCWARHNNDSCRKQTALTSVVWETKARDLVDVIFQPMDIEQLEQAVAVALRGDTDHALKQQAIDYLNEVKNSSDGWVTALSVITADTGRLPEAVFFSYQVLDTALSRLVGEQRKSVSDKLWHYVLNQARPDSPALPTHLRNKLAQTLALLFVYTYSSTWTSFFEDLQALASISPQGTDLYMRVLKAVHEEIGDTLIIRDAEEVRRNNALKDQIRANDLSQLTSSWGLILDQYSGKSDQQSLELLDGALKVVGGWVSWADIVLLLGNGALIPLIFKQFAVPELRLTTLDTICEIISKKMPPENKMELIAMLSLTDLLVSLDDDVEFDERVARTANVVAMELERIMDKGGPVGGQAEKALLDLLPTIIKYLAHAYDDVSVQVIPCINEYLQFVRREAKKARAGFDTSKLAKNHLGQYIDHPPLSKFIPAERLSVIKVLLQKIIEKSVYDDDHEWTGAGDDESENEFLDLRNKLKVLQEQIATIDIDLFVDDVAGFIKGKLSQESNSWQQTELALYELSVFGEILKGGAVKTARGTESRASQVLFELFAAMITSSVVRTSYPPIQLSYMELVHSHAQFFANLDFSMLFATLEVFASPLGIHNPDTRVRVRSWYLFYRLYKVVRKQLESQNVAGVIFNSVAPLLKIDAKLAVTEDDSESGLPDSIFTSQLYLFELCGMAFAGNGEQEAKLTQGLLELLFREIHENMPAAKAQSGSTPDVELARLKIHHAIMALGTFVRGLKDIVESESKGSVVAAEMKAASEMVVAVLENLRDDEFIREASRFTTSRLVSLLGSEILLQVSQVINFLLHSGTINELGDFMSFLGQMVHTFRTDAGVFDMFTSLCGPLFSHVFRSLQRAQAEAQTGSTDGLLLRKELIRDYLQLLFNLLNNRYGAMFLVNRETLEHVIESIFHYASICDNDVANQKQAILTLGKMVQLWGTGVVTGDNFGEGQPVELFDSPVIFEKLMELCFTLTSKPEFSLKDAQTRLAVLELGGLQKNIWEVRGDWYAEHLLKYLNTRLPVEVCQEFVVNLAQMPNKNFKRYFYDFLVKTQT